MGTNSPYFPDNVNSDEEAIVYLGQMVAALKAETYLTKTGAGPFTLTADEVVGTVVEFSGSTTAVAVTTPTAAEILAYMRTLDANAGVGSTAQFALINSNTSSGAITFTEGVGVTFVGTAAPKVVAITTIRRYQIKILTATTASFTVIG